MQTAQLFLWLMISADPAMPTASRVTLTGTQPLTKHASALMQQANVLIEIDRAVKDRQVMLDLQSVPFWEAVERLAQAADHRLAVSGPKISLFREPYRKVPVDLEGPFRTVVKKSHSKLDVETGQRTCEVQIQIVWEPKFKAFYVETPAKSMSAANDTGKSLRMIDDGSSKMPVAGQSAEITLRLADIPRSMQQIAQLQGLVKIVGTTQLLQFTFEAGKTGETTTQRQSGVAATFSRFQKRSRVWTAQVQFEYPKGGPEFESFQSFLLDNECWLQRPDGAKFPSTGFEVGGERGGGILVSYHFQENHKTGFALDDARGWKLVVRTPGPIIEVPLRFTLEQVPLP